MERKASGFEREKERGKFNHKKVEIMSKLTIVDWLCSSMGVSSTLANQAYIGSRALDK